MLGKNKKAQFPIETIDFEEKFKLPFIKNLTPFEIVKIYKNFSKIFPNINKKKKIY